MTRPICIRTFALTENPRCVAAKRGGDPGRKSTGQRSQELGLPKALSGPFGAAKRISKITQRLPLRAGNARTCIVCGSAIKPRRGSRRQKYCCYRCRDEARRARNFEVFATTRRVGASIPRSGGNNQSNPRACNGHFGDRTFGILAPRAVIQAEVFGNRRWRRVTSPDGVTCDVSHLP